MHKKLVTSSSRNWRATGKGGRENFTMHPFDPFSFLNNVNVLIRQKTN